VGAFGSLGVKVAEILEILMVVSFVGAASFVLEISPTTPITFSNTFFPSRETKSPILIR